MAVEISKSGKIKVPRGYKEAREAVLAGESPESVAQRLDKDVEILKQVAALAKDMPAAPVEVEDVTPEPVDDGSGIDADDQAVLDLL